MMTRQILRTSATSKTDISELLRVLWASELLAPGGQVWLVSPWISDVPVFDNSMSQFSGLCPSWPRRLLRLTDVLVRLLQLEVAVTVVTRQIPHNDDGFLLRLKELASAEADDRNLRLVQRAQENLHVKGIITGSFFVSGSMNLTYNGVVVLDELISVDASKDGVARARIQFRQLYG
jgi:hypothetical protein